MTMHGDMSFWAFLKWDRNQKSHAFKRDLYAHPGFRHFMGAVGPGPDQQFALYNRPFDPSDVYMWQDAERVMDKLAYVMTFELIDTDEDDDGVLRCLNRSIPSGYTYLLQIAAHDLVHSSLSVSRSKSQFSGLANIRHSPLRLETIYGDGTTQCPHAYETNESGFRNRLRLGRVRANDKPFDGSGDCLDIARARATETFDDSRCPYPEALIGDARNDSHAILSQMVVLFHQLHNAVLDYIVAKVPGTGDKFADSQRAYVVARTVCILVYRFILRNDLLPKVLHSDVWHAYDRGSVPILNTADGLEQGAWLAPLELTYGYLRFAHSMIGMQYKFNSENPAGFSLDKVLNYTSERNSIGMPFETRWVADWSTRFFSIDPKTANFSMRIGPHAGQPFQNALGQNELKHKGALIYRDLMSSIAAQPWSIRGLIEQIWPTHGELLNLSDLYRRHSDTGDWPWTCALRSWLTPRSKNTGYEFSDDDVTTLARDPPIPFFVRYEAFHESQGCQLGILGSIVIADVFFGIFKHDKVMGIESSGTLSDQLSQLSADAFSLPDALSLWSGLTTFGSLRTSINQLSAARVHEQPS